MEQLRPYCERAHLADFDAFAARVNAPKPGDVCIEVPREQLELGWSAEHRQTTLRHALSAAAQDHEGRARDMDHDGIAAEVIFHSSQNGQPLPFTSDFALHIIANDLKLGSVGLRIYNRWLADFCSLAPDRRGGLIQIPVWDPEGCIREVEWARDAGLRGVNLPVIRPHDTNIPLYTEPVWEPFFSACESLELPLCSHGSGLDQFTASRYHGFGNMALQFAYGNVNSRHTAWWLIFTGILGRHPGLRYVLTEIPGDWVVSDLRYMDSVYKMDAQRELRKVVHKSPSEYFRTQIYLGASMMSHREAHRFLDDLGLDETVMWGSDYPHLEGTWPRTTLSLRKTFHDFAPATVRKVCADNAAELFGFDVGKLQPIADRIGPTYAEIAEPLDADPADLQYSFSFREDGPYT
jgi:predicted TIM-barrel fold metal-dependent hydrolase